VAALGAFNGPTPKKCEVGNPLTPDSCFQPRLFEKVITELIRKT